MRVIAIYLLVMGLFLLPASNWATIRNVWLAVVGMGFVGF